MTYRKTTIGLGVAAIVSWIAYFAGVVYAEETNAPHTPFYGAFAYVALALSFAALVFFAIGRQDRRAAASHQATAAPPAPTRPDAATRKPSPHPRRPVEAIDDAPTVPVPIRAQVPSPRRRTVLPGYRCDTEAPQSPLTVEMVRHDDVAPRLATAFEAGTRVGFDRGFSAAAGLMPPDRPDETDSGADLN